MYFSILTLAFSALCFTVAFRWTALTGGENGLGGIERRSIAGISLDQPLVFYAFVAIIAFVIAAFLLRLKNSPFGHVLVAIRENEVRTRFLGYPVMSYKLLAFVVSATVTGLAGGLSVLNHRIASAESLSVAFSGELLAIVLIGGMRSYAGPIFGALFFVLFREYLSMFTENWLLYFGLVFILFILFSPSGLTGIGQRVWHMLRPPKETEAAMSARNTPPTVGAFPSFLPQHLNESIEVVGISKRFGGIAAVSNVSTHISAHGVHALIGPNGAGKTSFFNLLSGMFAPDSGSVRFKGHDLAGQPPNVI